jgi:hypothetical protein
MVIQVSLSPDAQKKKTSFRLMPSDLRSLGLTGITLLFLLRK